MELINPDGSRKDVPLPQPEPEKVAPFKADFNTPGWMKLEINIEQVSHSRAGQWQLMGFMDDHKMMALNIVRNIVAQREAVKQEITKANNTGMFRNFLGKKR